MTHPEHNSEQIRHSKAELLTAVEAAVAERSIVAPPPPPGRFRRGWILPALLVLGLVSGGLLLLPPAWLRTPPPAPDPPAIADASNRMALVREAWRVTTFRDSSGHLPATLSIAGGPGDSHIVYTPGPAGTFTLQIGPPPALILRSTDDITAFLGKSYRSLSERNSR